METERDSIGNKYEKLIEVFSQPHNEGQKDRNCWFTPAPIHLSFYMVGYLPRLNSNKPRPALKSRQFFCIIGRLLYQQKERADAQLTYGIISEEEQNRGTRNPARGSKVLQVRKKAQTE